MTGRPVEFQGRMSSPGGPISGTASVHHCVWRRARCTLGRRITAPCRRRPSLSPARRCLVRRDGQNRHDEPAGKENIANTLEEVKRGLKSSEVSGRRHSTRQSATRVDKQRFLVRAADSQSAKQCGLHAATVSIAHVRYFSRSLRDIRIQRHSV